MECEALFCGGVAERKERFLHVFVNRETGFVELHEMGAGAAGEFEGV
jgi:hypothetical protein